MGRSCWGNPEKLSLIIDCATCHHFQSCCNKVTQIRHERLQEVEIPIPKVT